LLSSLYSWLLISAISFRSRTPTKRLCCWIIRIEGAHPTWRPRSTRQKTF